MGAEGKLPLGRDVQSKACVISAVVTELAQGETGKQGRRDEDKQARAAAWRVGGDLEEGVQADANPAAAHGDCRKDGEIALRPVYTAIASL